jgi:Xaa-Pro aminopeptidase
MPALLLYADSERSPAIRHEVPVGIGDPFLFAELDGRRVVLTTPLERDRIAAAAPDLELLDMFELGLKELILEGRHVEDAVRDIAVRAALELGVRDAVVPGDFPLALGDKLRAAGVTVRVDDDAVEGRRRAKTGRELDGVRTAQRAAEAGMAAAAARLGAARPGADGRLDVTAEEVREELRAACAEHGAPCPPDVIVASVWDGTGHEPGSGPLPAGLPIQVDLWPRDEATSCWADMTRTFVVGEPAADAAAVIADHERLVRAALEDVRGLARPGVTGRELYDIVCDRFEAAGHATLRTGEAEDGFQFSLGHGVGLDVHEAPGLGLGGRDPLVPGDVLAVEPGLWDQRFGGVRFEDLLLVTEAGCETLTDFPYDLTPRA